MSKSIPKYLAYMYILVEVGLHITCIIAHPYRCTDNKGHRDVELYLRDVGLELAQR